MILQIKKFYWLFLNHGFFKACQITWMKIWYVLHVRGTIQQWIKVRPPIVKNRIVFHSSVDYSDNARALSDYLVSQGYLKDHEIIWLVRHPELFTKYEQPNLRFVYEKYANSGCRTKEAFEAVYTAEKIFFTHSMRWVPDVDRKPEQQFINLWHGCAYKSAKGQSEDISFDYVLVPGEVFIETKSEFFQCDKAKILPIGYPRYDLMLSRTQKGREYMNSFKNTAKDKLLFWMPTYRISKSINLSEDTLTGELNLPIFDTLSQLKDLNEILSKRNVVMILKRHYLQAEYNLEDTMSHIRYMDDKDLGVADVQLYEAISAADALITDYSSVAIDFLLLDKPIGYTLDDYYKYEQSRGFVFEDPREYMPGMHIYNVEEFYEFIRMIEENEDQWSGQRKQVLEVTHNLPDHTGYCERICKEMKI